MAFHDEPQNTKDIAHLVDDAEDNKRSRVWLKTDDYSYSLNSTLVAISEAVIWVASASLATMVMVRLPDTLACILLLVTAAVALIVSRQSTGSFVYYACLFLLGVALALL